MLILIRCPFHPMLLQWHVKDPGHSAKSPVGRLHLNMHTPLTQQSRSGLTMPLSTHSVDTSPETSSHAILSGNIRPQSSQLAEPLWTNSGMKSGISVRELISTLHFKKKKKKPWREMHGRTFSPNPRKRGKSHHQCVALYCTASYCIIVYRVAATYSDLLLCFALYCIVLQIMYYIL